MTRQRLLTILAPALLLLGASGAAHASPVFANTATTSSSSSVSVTITNSDSPLDGVRFVLIIRNATSPPPTASIDFAFPTAILGDVMTVWASAQNASNVSTALVTALVDGSGNVATRTGTATTVPNVGGGGWGAMNLALPWASFTTPVGFDFATVQTVRVRFDLSSTNPGPTGIRMDAVMVAPEPGALPLFGLGAIGMIALARKRRRRRALRAGHHGPSCAKPSPASA